jgi:photosystem II stability/assembly factor-like uncharacterized protein
MKIDFRLIFWMFFASYSLAGPAGAEQAEQVEKKENLFVIHQILLDPQDSRRLFSATSNYGILETEDGGRSWKWSNQGLRSFTHRALAVQPNDSRILFAGGWGGGVSKSVDRGAHWTPVNAGLGNTAVEDIAIDSLHPETIYIATTTGVFRSLKGGGDWRAYSTGLPVSEIENFECLIFLPTGSIELLLGTSQGLYQKRRGKDEWEAAEGSVEKEDIVSFAMDGKTGYVYAGTVKNGLFRSRDGGGIWRPLGGRISKAWVSDVALDSNNSTVIYAATRGMGVLKSLDGGDTWQETNKGLPTQDIRCLGIDPSNSDVLYAGTTNEGIVKTEDGGKSWVQLEGYPLMTMSEIIESISGPLPPEHESSDLKIPPNFFKCNQCHGWTDRRLNSKRTYWRVPPNLRDWGPTVERMSKRARLTKVESADLTKFLNAYSRKPR